MENGFKIINENDNESIIMNNGHFNDGSRSEFNIISESPKQKMSNFISPNLNSANETLGLDLLMNNKSKIASDQLSQKDASSVASGEKNKVHLFNSSSSSDNSGDDDDDDDDDDQVQQETHFKPSNYFGGDYNYRSEEDILKEKN